MENLGILFLLITCVVSSFAGILKAIERLNAYRDLVLNIDKAGEHLTRDQKSILLRYNYMHLFLGVVFFCIVLSVIVIGIPSFVSKLKLWEHVCIYLIFAFILTSTCSIALTSIQSMRIMCKFINSMTQSEDDSKESIIRTTEPDGESNS